MKKNTKTKIVALSFTAILLVGGITVFAASQQKLIFKDRNGNEITVLTNEQKEFLNNKKINPETIIPDGEEVEIGQIIQVNGEDAIVFAIGEDGSYITVSPKIYNEFQNSK